MICEYANVGGWVYSPLKRGVGVCCVMVILSQFAILPQVVCVEEV